MTAKYLCLALVLSAAAEYSQDLKVCKVTHAGIGYTGSVSKTGQGLRCKKWADKDIAACTRDEDFPEGSRSRARNYCRNPLRNASGPWCYTSRGRADSCDIPLCVSSECRMSGPGMEYSGKISRSVTSEKCSQWNKDVHKTMVRAPTVMKGEKYSTVKFHKKDLANAGFYCRNPDGDLGGPWCYNEASKTNIHQKHYCDIPLCDDRHCELYAKPTGVYHTYTTKTTSRKSMAFSVRLWDPDDEKSGAMSLVLSVVDVPASKKDLRRWGCAVELLLSNNGTKLTIGNKVESVQDTPNLLKSTEYTNFTLTWKENLLVLGKEGIIKPLLVAELDCLGYLVKRHESEFKYYSVAGNNILVDFPSCYQSIGCEVHTTFYPKFTILRPLRQKNLIYDLKVFVRTFHSAMIIFTLNPYYEYPRVVITVAYDLNNVTKIEYQKDPMQNFVLAQLDSPGIVNYFTYTEFHVTMFGQEMELIRISSSHEEPILKARHESMKELRWFSLGSLYSKTHWAIYCKPEEVKAAYPPECVMSAGEREYNGTQSVTSQGSPCVPWTDPSLNLTVEKIPTSDLEVYVNYCRNLNGDPLGPWCNALSANGVSKQYCHVRICDVMKCKVAGTADDYVGTLNKTRSKRECKVWPKVVGQWNDVIPNDTRSEEYSNVDENHCRNPTLSMAGAWCYTVDSNVTKDLCNVKDCLIKENVILATRSDHSRYIYMLPEWKSTGSQGGLYFSAKQWNPNIQDGLLLKTISLDHTKFYTLYIGAKNNEKVILRYTDTENSVDKILLEKSLPYLIQSGKWGDFWLQLPKGQLRFGLQNYDYPVFEWSSLRKSEDFEQMYLVYQSLEGNVVGVHFREDKCHVENVSSVAYARFYPMTIWRSPSVNDTSLVMHLRGTGVAKIALIVFPEDPVRFEIVIGENADCISIIRSESPSKYLTTIKLETEAITASAWTRFDIRHTEENVEVLRNSKSVLTWTADVPFLTYWFTVGSDKGWLLWTANCDPPHVDSPAVHGGWSQWTEWRCSVTCGGGVGVRTRVCDSPKPSMLGRMCEGETTESGRCGDFDCGEISPHIYETVRWNLRREYFNIIAMEGSNVQFTVPSQLIEKIQSQAPATEIRWNFNGEIISMDSKRRVVQNNTVLIKHVSKKDSGTYTCMLYGGDRVKTPIKVIVVTVESIGYNKRISEDSSLTIVCKSQSLRQIYADLTATWLLNDTVYLDKGLTNLFADDNLHIEHVRPNHTGKWSCLVQQPDLGLKWTTNTRKVLVNAKQSIFSLLISDEFVKNLIPSFLFDEDAFEVMVVVISLCCLLVFFSSLVYYLVKSKSRRRPDVRCGLRARSGTSTREHIARLLYYSQKSDLKRRQSRLREEKPLMSADEEEH